MRTILTVDDLFTIPHILHEALANERYTRALFAFGFSRRSGIPKRYGC